MYEYEGPEDWDKSSLYELATWRNGLAFKNIDFAPEGRPVIKIAELKSGITAQTARTMAEYDPSVFVRDGDMLFSWSGNPDTSIDVFRWRGEDGWLNQHIFKMTAGPRVSDEFLFFLLRWLRPRFAEIARNKQTTGLGHVTGRDLRQMIVGVPDPCEQDAIVSVIAPIERKIELNRRMNETLEAMARAIFRDWFVDFGPTRAKMTGAAPYLAADLWALFPDRFDEEGRPQAWPLVALDELIELNPRETLRNGEEAPYLEMAALPTSGATHDVPVGRAASSGSRFRNGDTLLARITPCLENGKTAFVFGVPQDRVGWGSTEFIVMRPRPPLPSEFGYLLARDEAFRAHAVQSMTGTSGRQRVQVPSLAGYRLTEPPKDVARSFGKLVGPLFRKIEANADESRTLAQTRDLLLPKLMSGEIRLKEAERVLEDAA